MKLRKHAATCAVSALLVLALTGCSTTVGTNWSIYSRYMKQVLGGSNTKTTTAASSAASTATAIDAPASITVSGDSYTFSGVAGSDSTVCAYFTSVEDDTTVVSPAQEIHF